jgi:hypothetical protein
MSVVREHRWTKVLQNAMIGLDAAQHQKQLPQGPLEDSHLRSGESQDF